MMIQVSETDIAEVAMVDVAFLTALPLERDALLRRLEAWEAIQDEREPLTYYRGHVSIPETRERYEVVLVLLLGMGNEEAAISTVKVLKRWQPATVFLVGIAGGLPDRVTLGDVVVADFVYAYEYAKQISGKHQRRAQHFPTDRLLYGRTLAYEASEWRNDITLTRPDVALENLPMPGVHFGAIGSGEKVIADARMLSRLQKACPQLVAVAMEGAGVARAVAQQPQGPAFLEVRGICDYANEQKDDRWQPFAAEVASAFVVGLLRARPFPPLRALKSVPIAREQRSLLVLCAQSLRPIASDELLEALSQQYGRAPTIENMTLDITDLVASGTLTDPEQAVQRLTVPGGVLEQALRRRGEVPLAFHGLVHIPLAFLIGHLATDRAPIQLFDFHPDRQTWIWPGQHEAFPSLEVREEPERIARRQRSAVIRLSFSYAVTAAQTRRVFPYPSLEIDLTVPQPERGVIQSEQQIRAYGLVFRSVLDRLAQDHPALERVHLFYAGPVALAFHFGQQISEHIHPAVTVWNFCRGYDWGVDLAAAALRQPCITYPRSAAKGVSL